MPLSTHNNFKYQNIKQPNYLNGFEFASQQQPNPHEWLNGLKGFSGLNLTRTGLNVGSYFFKFMYIFQVQLQGKTAGRIYRSEGGGGDIPSTEEEAAEGGEEEPGLESWVDEVNGLQILFDGHRECLVDRSEGRDTRKVLGPLHVRVHVHQTEGSSFQQWENLLLQVLFQPLETHGTTYIKTTNRGGGKKKQTRKIRTYTVSRCITTSFPFASSASAVIPHVGTTREIQPTQISIFRNPSSTQLKVNRWAPCAKLY